MVKKNKNNKIGFIVNSVKTSDVEKTADFGTFKLSRTKDSIIFSTYMGYTVIINRYTMSPNGNVGDLSLFAWLDMMITESDYCKAHLDEQYQETDLTCRDWLDMMTIITWANLTHPCVVFVNGDAAAEAANNNIRWIKSMTNKLKETMESEPPKEDIKADAKTFGEAIERDNLEKVLKADTEE